MAEHNDVKIKTERCFLTELLIDAPFIPNPNLFSCGMFQTGDLLPTVVTPTKTPREPFGRGNRTHGKMCLERKGHDDAIAVEKEDIVANLGGLKIRVAQGHYKIRPQQCKAYWIVRSYW